MVFFNLVRNTVRTSKIKFFSQITNLVPNLFVLLFIFIEIKGI